MLFRTSLLVCFVSVVWAQYGPSTPLPALPVNLWDASSALNTWYQIGDIPQPYESTFKYCTFANYNLLRNGSVQVINTARDSNSPQATSCVVYGTATPSMPGSTLWNLLLWSNPCTPALYGQIRGQLQWNFVWPPTSTHQTYEAAIATGLPGNNIYVLSRAPTLGYNAMAAVQSYLARFGGAPSIWQPTVQAGCW